MWLKVQEFNREGRGAGSMNFKFEMGGKVMFRGIISIHKYVCDSFFGICRVCFGSEKSRLVIEVVKYLKTEGIRLFKATGNYKKPKKLVLVQF